MFLDHGGDKRVRRKNYIGANFYTDPEEPKSQSGYILKVGAISQSSYMQSIVDIEYLQNTYDSEYDRLVDFVKKNVGTIGNDSQFLKQAEFLLI